MSVVPSQSLKDEAATALHKGSHKKALRCFTALERLEPENGEWSLQVGVMYHRLGKRRQAVQALQRAGQRCQLQQELERSYAIYQQILKLDPGNDAARCGLESLEKQSASTNSSTIQGKAGVKVLPASGATFPTVVAERTPHPIRAQEMGGNEFGLPKPNVGSDGFGLPKSKAGRVAMALAALKA